MPFEPNPGADTVLAPGSVLIAFGSLTQIEALAALAAPRSMAEPV